MCDLLTFSQRAIQADISDGDYRTYMVLCALALDNLAEAGLFATELTYAEIGAHHPKAMTDWRQTDVVTKSTANCHQG